MDAVAAENLCARMKGISEYSRDFRVKLDDEIHYCQVKFVRVAGDDEQFIAGLRNIDAQVRSEQERQKVLQDALASAQHANRAKTTFLNNMSHDLRTIIQADINSKQLDLFIDTVDVINEDVTCDKLCLNQILLNLLSSAIKSTKPGGMVSLRIIQTKESAKGHAGYEFRVKDTGIGMSKEFQERIFETFTRERTSTVSGIQGMGLGMAITKSIVDITGGTISVNSEVGKGTEFTVKLQFRISSPVKQEVIPELQGLRALVADDDANTCMSIASMCFVSAECILILRSAPSGRKSSSPISPRPIR